MIENGKILTKNLQREVMTRSELERALRKHELILVRNLPSIQLALLEEDGTVSVLHRKKHPD